MNTAAIDKIIAERSFRDFRAANPLKKDGRPKYKKHHPYALSADTLEAVDVKHDYLAGKITEEQYKAYCLRHNLIGG